MSWKEAVFLFNAGILILLTMILALDAYYYNEKAKVTGICFEEFHSDTENSIASITLDCTNEYVSGEFYKKELPCLLEMISRYDLSSLKYIIVDGYVYLDDSGKKGLGHYLYDQLEIKVPVIGIAKNSFYQNKKHVTAVFRGKSQKPLYVTAIGADAAEISPLIQQMAGEYRIPSLLKKLDVETKNV